MVTYFKEKKDKREFIINRKFNQKMDGVVKDFQYENQNKSGVCNDKSRITLKTDKKNITDVKHMTNACVITTSCVDIICEKILNKTISESKEFLLNFEKFVNRDEFNKEMLEELIVFEDIVEKATRDYCLKLPLNLILDIVKKINF